MTEAALISRALTAALTVRAGRWYCQRRMQTIADASDGDVARAVAARMPGPAEAAEGELYRRFAPRVRLYGLRHLRDEGAARDLVQHVMLITIEKLRDGLIRDAEQIASFILGVSRTASIDLKRRERRREPSRCPPPMQPSTLTGSKSAWPGSPNGSGPSSC
jgi:DNA-directed RNA polymerase specialized sigma24 family protein